jgi:hypothetical protein
VETGLVVVGGADSSLRLSRRKKKLESLTQVPYPPSGSHAARRSSSPSHRYRTVPLHLLSVFISGLGSDPDLELHLELFAGSESIRFLDLRIRIHNFFRLKNTNFSKVGSGIFKS